jgi:hypothetical protein
LELFQWKLGPIIGIYTEDGWLPSTRTIISPIYKIQMEIDAIDGDKLIQKYLSELA